MKSIVLSSAFLFLSASALADVCITHSHGLYFQGTSDDSVLAASLATDQCTANRFAEAGECSQNLTCDANLAPIYTSGEITCYTQSAGQGFEGRDADINVASSSAFDQCMSDSSSNSSECTSQLSCYDSASAPQPEPQPGTPPGDPSMPPPAPPIGGTNPGVPAPVPGPVLPPVAPPVTQPPVAQPPTAPYVYCGTRSGSQFFHSEGYGDSVARGETIRQCTSTFGSNPAECFQFISCALTPGGVRVPAPGGVVRPLPPRRPVVVAPPIFPIRRPPVLVRPFPGRPLFPGRGPRGPLGPRFPH